MAHKDTSRKTRFARRCKGCGELLWEDPLNPCWKCPACGEKRQARKADDTGGKIARLLDARSPGWAKTVALPAALCAVVVLGAAFLVRGGAALARPDTEVRTACGNCEKPFVPAFEKLAAGCPGCRRACPLQVTTCPHCSARMAASDVMDVQVRAPGDTKPFRSFCVRCLGLFPVRTRGNGS